MKREILQLYKEGAPGLTETEDGYLRGPCPFCEEGGFMAGGLRNASTGEETNDFLCLDCDRQGSPEEFLKALRERPETAAEQPEVSSHLRIPGEILSFLTLDLPTRELQILLYLQTRGSGISAKEIGEELQIPQGNIHRYLAGLERKWLIYAEGRPKRYFKIDDARLLGKFRRKSNCQI